MCSEESSPEVGAFHYAAHRTGSNYCIQNQDGHQRGAGDLLQTIAGCRVPARMDQTTLWVEAVSMSRPVESVHESHLGLPRLWPDSVVQHKKEKKDESTGWSICIKQASDPLELINHKAVGMTGKLIRDHDHSEINFFTASCPRFLDRISREARQP